MKRAALILALITLPVLSGGVQAQTKESAPAQRILVQNKYYPKPGKEADVLATRLEASAVRKKLGLVVGVVLVRQSEADGSALVIWEAEYPSIDARRADEAAVTSVEEFKAVQAKMRGLTVKFERDTWVIRQP